MIKYYDKSVVRWCFVKLLRSVLRSSFLRTHSSFFLLRGEHAIFFVALGDARTSLIGLLSAARRERREGGLDKMGGLDSEGDDLGG